MIKTVVVLLLVSSALCYGGYVRHEITETNSNRAFDALNNLNDGKNSFVSTLAASRPVLVFYGTQLVAGLMHAMVYKTNGLESPYACVKVFEHLTGEFSLKEGEFASSMEEAANKCKIPMGI